MCLETDTRFVFAFLLVAHGIAHLVGFISSWKLATLAELPYRTTVFAGRLDVGDAGIRVIAVLWLLAALAFLVAAIALATATCWAGPFMLAAVIAYVREVSARTEQYWCPIKHASPVPAPHSHYQLFFDYGDAEGYRRELPAIRRALRQARAKMSNRATRGKP